MKHLPTVARFVFWAAIVAISLVVTTRVAYSELALPQTALQISFISPSDSGTALITSPTAAWSSGEPQSLPSLVGINQATFDVPNWSGPLVRWDPGSMSGSYKISEIQFIISGTAHDVDLVSAVVTPEGREARQDVTITSEGALLLTSSDEDPQLLIEVPDAALVGSKALLTTLSILSAIAGVALSAALWRRRRWQEETMAMAFVGWLYAVFWIYVFRYASRLPFWDDWRYLRDVNESGRLPVSLKRLLTPFNDTVTATGRFIDSTVLNATNFNFLALQMIGVALLGVYVVLMIILIRIIGHRIAPAATPYAILLVGFSLTAMAYFLEPAITYQGFLPLLFGAAILLVLRAKRHTAPRVLAVTVLGLLAGFGYISGALMLLAMAIAFILTFITKWPRLRDLGLLAPGLALVFVAVFTTASQIYLVGRFQGSLAASSSVAASVYPWEPDFWAFFFGLVGRATGLRSGPVLLHIAIVLVLLSAPIVALIIVRKSNRFGGSPHDGFALLFASILAPLYTAAIAFGRAGGDAGRSFGDVMQAGSARAHYWWVAALIPLIWLAWVAFLRVVAQRDSRQLAAVLLVMVTLVIAVPKSPLPWHYPSEFANRDIAFDRNATCVSSNVLQGIESFSCRHASSGDIGPQVGTAYRFDMVFIDQAGLPDGPSAQTTP